jgi:hypothetical protein
MVDEALAVLGLLGSPEQADIRRAYLRKVKEHPPERDADGFRRVREAYDFLKGNPWLLTQRVRAEVVVEEPPPAAAVVAEPGEQNAEKAADAENAEEEAWTASFPPFVREQIDALNRALKGDDPAAAAGAMIELYDRPLLESAPTPPPILALRTYIVLVELGRLKLATSLLAAFERYMEVQQVPVSGGGEIGARWKLAREVQATLELDKPLGRAVAAGLRSGQLYTAAKAVDGAYNRHLEELERHMSRRAPTLWSSLAPLLQQRQQPPRVRDSGFSFGFGKGTWLLGFLCIKLLWFCSTALFRPASTTRAPEPDSFNEPVPLRAAATPPATMLPNTPPPQLAFDHGVPYVPEEVLERQLSGSWGSIEHALQVGDCQAVREQWPLYRAALAGSHVDEKREKGRQRDVLAMCSELKDLLEEP